MTTNCIKFVFIISLFVTLHLEDQLVFADELVEKVAIDEYPFYVALQKPLIGYIKLVFTIFCGGAIVGENAILTSASCAQKFVLSTDRIIVGADTINYLFQSYDTIYKAEAHFTYSDIKNFPSNIALIAVRKIIDFGEKVNKIGFLTNNMSMVDEYYPSVIIGHTAKGIHLKKELRRENVFISNWARCHDKKFVSQIFCVIKHQETPSLDQEHCLGIDGSPVISANEKGETILLGVMAEAEECWIENIAFRASHFRRWIKDLTLVAKELLKRESP